jgi:hypothetical protein
MFFLSDETLRDTEAQLQESQRLSQDICVSVIAPQRTYFTYEAGSLKWQNKFRKVLLAKFLHHFLKN